MRNIIFCLVCLFLIAVAGQAAGWDVRSNGTALRGERVLEEENVTVISAPARLKIEGRFRGSAEPWMKMDIGVIWLDAGACPRFEVTAGREEAVLLFRLTDTAGESLEGAVKGSGRVEFEGVRGGEYILSLENLTAVAVDFTVHYDFGGILI